jgi:uncharacterized protein YjiS (DUF1127 family)
MRRREFIMLVDGSVIPQDAEVRTGATSPSRIPLSFVKHRLLEWRRRLRSRRDLMNLSDTELRDIGLSRCNAEFESSKPFWLD